MTDPVPLPAAVHAALLQDLQAAVTGAVEAAVARHVTPAPEGGPGGPGGPPVASGVTVHGRDLHIDGVRRQIAGWNLFGATGCHTGRRYPDGDLDRFFRSLPARSLTRCWGFRPQGLDNLRAVADRAAAAGQMLLVSLGDGVCHCSDEDGASAGKGSKKTTAWYTGGYRSLYRPWVDRVTKEFAQHPGVGGWEPLNEPIGQSGKTLRAFYDDIGGLIHANSPGKPVFSGQRAAYDFPDGAAGYKLAHESAGVDVLSIHEYDFDHNASKRIMSGWWSPATQTARELGKPVIIGEVGIGVPGKTGATRDSRVAAMREKIRGYFADGAAGVFYWNRYLADSGEGYAVDTWDDPLIAAIRDESK